jgi:hypothetical protein
VCFKNSDAIHIVSGTAFPFILDHCPEANGDGNRNATLQGYIAILKRVITPLQCHRLIVCRKDIYRDNQFCSNAMAQNNAEKIETIIK